MSNLQDVGELIKLLLAQQQRQQNQQQQVRQPAASPFAAAPFHQQPEMPPPAPVRTAPNPSTSLMDYLRNSAPDTSVAAAPPAPKPQPQDVHALLRTYLQNQANAMSGSVPPVPSPAFANEHNGLSFPQVLHQQVQALPQVQQQKQQALPQALNQPQLNQLQNQEQSLLSNIQLLAGINPEMVVEALARAMTTNQGNQHQGDQVVQLNQLQAQNYQQPPQQQRTQWDYQNHQPLPQNSTLGRTTNQARGQDPFAQAPQQMQGVSNQSSFVPNHQLGQQHPSAFGSTPQARNTTEVNEMQSAPANGSQVVPARNKGFVSQNEGNRDQTQQPAKKDFKAMPKGIQTPKVATASTSPTKAISNPTASLPAIHLPVTAAAATSTPIHTPGEDILQHWKLDRLEMHVNQLKLANQPIPHHAAVLLFNARRREERLQAKRISNRKSATNQREKKKAFLENLAKYNSTLRKKASILEKMPDLVMVTNYSGDITFCGGQVEQLLRHKKDDLLGSNILNLVEPESRRAVHRLFRDLLPAKQQTSPEVESGTGSSSRREQVEDKGNNSNRSSDANMVSSRSSDKSFPMLEVNVDAMNESPNARDDVSDSSSGDNRGKRKHTGDGEATEPSSLTRQKSSFAESSSGNENRADEETNTNKKVKIVENTSTDERLSSSNTTSSKTSDESKQDGIHRHIEHSMKLKPSIKTSSATSTQDRSYSSAAESGYQNDRETSVDGAQDSSDRDSNESAEDSFSSSFDSRGENPKKRRSRLVPVYKVRFVRNDLTTVWCELTSSFCTKSSSIKDDGSFDAEAELAAIKNPRGLKSLEEPNEPEEEKEETDELLICIRPTYEGRPVSSEYRFVPNAAKTERDLVTVSDNKSANAPTSSSENESGNASDQAAKHPGPPKKRHVGNEASHSKKQRKGSSINDTDVNAAQSLLEFHSKK